MLINNQWSISVILLMVCCTAVLSRIRSYPYSTEYKYILADYQRCRTASPDILIWVQGRASTTHLRSMIRETYGNSANWPSGLRVLVIFFTGAPSRHMKNFQPILNYEFEQYRDIVQNDYIEDYRNQTCKFISAINYISDYCPNVSLIIRVDDDVIFHPILTLPQLALLMTNSSTKSIRTPQSLSALYSLNRTITCRLISDFGIWRYKDHPNHFNAVDDTVLPGETLYPPFCAGFFISMSGDVPRLLQKQLNKHKPFWMDDRYMGVLQKYANTTNIDISQYLDFGYNDITRENLDLMLHNNTMAKHLPGKFKNHMSQLYEYISLGVRGLRGHFSILKYRRR